MFEAFYRHHIRFVERFVARRFRDVEDVADLTADIFLAAIDSAATYQPARGAPIAWLYGIARNVVAARLRQRSRDLQTVSKVSGQRLLDADAIARLEEQIDAERRCRRLYDALGALPVRDRALIEMVSVDGMSVSEAAGLLGMKPGPARVRLHRSRALVKSQLQPDEQPLAAATTKEVTS